MIDERKTAIITYIDENFMENLEQDFLHTLFVRAKYQGKVIVLNYGIDSQNIKELEEHYNVSFVKCEKIMPVFSNRYIDIPKAIDSLDKSITHVALMDGGDIWFQDNITDIFEKTINGIGCVEEERIIGEDDFTEYCMNKLNEEERKRLKGVLGGKNVKNSGVICGPRNMVKKIVIDVAQNMLNHGTEFFGIDQLYFNFNWYQLDDENRVRLDESYNYVLVSNQGKYKVIGENVYSDTDDLVKVVHNAGANWRMLNRPFRNAHVNEEQYVGIRQL